MNIILPSFYILNEFKGKESTVQYCCMCFFFQTSQIQMMNTEKIIEGNKPIDECGIADASTNPHIKARGDSHVKNEGEPPITDGKKERKKGDKIGVAGPKWLG